MQNELNASQYKRHAARLLLLLVALLSLWLLAACGGGESEVSAPDALSASDSSETLLSSLSEQIGAVEGEATEAIEVEEPSDVEEAVEAATATDEPTEAPTESPTEQPPTNTPRPTATPTPAATAVPARINGLPTILEIDLPPEAWDTLDLIDNNGPFPFDRDGITFQNREGLLPGERRGYYSEYTVITPGERTRGARRIIAGEGGEFYYTDDHYESFFYIVRPER